MRMTDKGARPYQPDITVIPPDPALGRIRRIGTAQAFIIVGLGYWGGRHRGHPSPILGHQWHQTYHVGRT